MGNYTDDMEKILKTIEELKTMQHGASVTTWRGEDVTVVIPLLNEDRARLLTERDELQTRNDNQRDQIDGLNAECSELRTKVESLQADARSFEGQIIDLVRKNRELWAKVAEAKNVLTDC